MSNLECGKCGRTSYYCQCGIVMASREITPATFRMVTPITRTVMPGTWRIVDVVTDTRGVRVAGLVIVADERGRRARVSLGRLQAVAA